MGILQMMTKAFHGYLCNTYQILSNQGRFLFYFLNLYYFVILCFFFVFAEIQPNRNSSRLLRHLRNVFMAHLGHNIVRQHEKHILKLVSYNTIIVFFLTFIIILNVL